ncbi:MAG: DinB family protein [Candidatus Rokubacteria bacterium]|nr:DinB family protein [Candidatus Rokubacteria bacterium]
MPRPEPDVLLAALLDARDVELQVLGGLSDAQMRGTPGHFLEPPIWEMGHVGWFQEVWILRHLDGAAPLRRGADALYDSFRVPYRQRWELDYPCRAETERYIAEILERAVARLASRRPTEQDVYFYTLVTLHEDMHAENALMTARFGPS